MILPVELLGSNPAASGPRAGTDASLLAADCDRPVVSRSVGGSVSGG